MYRSSVMRGSSAVRGVRLGEPNIHGRKPRSNCAGGGQAGPRTVGLTAGVSAPHASPAASTVRMVTLSATYGSGGSVVAPKLAERLGLPFADRLIPARGSTDLPTAEESLTDEERDQVRGAGCWTAWSCWPRG